MFSLRQESYDFLLRRPHRFVGDTAPASPVCRFSAPALLTGCVFPLSAFWAVHTQSSYAAFRSQEFPLNDIIFPVAHKARRAYAAAEVPQGW